MITGSQARAARAMAKLTVAELAQRADVAPNTITRVEADKSVNTATLRVIQAALEAAGVIFIPENGGGAGVRIRKGGAAPPQAQPAAMTPPASRQAAPAPRQVTVSPAEPATTRQRKPTRLPIPPRRVR